MGDCTLLGEASSSTKRDVKKSNLPKNTQCVKSKCILCNDLDYFKIFYVMTYYGEIIYISIAQLYEGHSLASVVPYVKNIHSVITCLKFDLAFGVQPSTNLE